MMRTSGIKSRSKGLPALSGPVEQKSDRRILREGFVVGITNPKAAVFFAAISRGIPVATIRPPADPPSGPSSTTWSAAG